MPQPSVDRFRTLLDFIASHEGTANQPGGGYNTSLAYGRFLPGGQEQILTDKTLAEIDELQTYMLNNPENNFNSSAIGRYQIVRTTLRSLRSQLGLSEDELFAPDLQDQLGVVLIERRGRNAHGLRAEWASLNNVSDAEIYEAYDAQG